MRRLAIISERSKGLNIKIGEPGVCWLLVAG